ncbi:MAG: GGDEF domain-containing protein [Demequinaceae bacterium]|nr:GGDEF domain-containing protein [Demequinaceae bacterium]
MDSTESWGDRQYWARHFAMGIIMSIMAPSIVLIRTYVGSDTSPNSVSVGLAVAFLSTVPALLFFARPILASPQLPRFFYAWDAVGVVAVIAWAALDGGGSSPYSAFFFVLVGHATLAFPPRATLISGLSVVLARLLLGLFDKDEPLVDTVLQVLVLGLMVAVAFSMVRGQRALVRRSTLLTEQAVRLSEVDGLTGCFNHRAFHARLAEEASHASPVRPLSVLVLDIDHFKEINDGYGHLAGDEVLARLGELLHTSFRSHDVVGRIGGDEFAVLLPDADKAAAAALQDRLLRGLAEGALPHGGTVTIGTASTMVAAEARRLLGAADAQLYAKRRQDRVSS